MIKNIKKIIKNPNNLTKVFYGATILVLLERIFALCYSIATNTPMHAYWSPIKYSVAWTALEYTLALLLPLAGFAYFCSSKYAKHTNNKIKIYIITYAMIAVLYFCMLGQITNSFVWFILDIIGMSGDALTNAIATIPGFGRKLYMFIRAITLYVPLNIIPLTVSPLLEIFDNTHALNGLKTLTVLPSSGSKKGLTVPKCDVKLCSDLNTGKDVIVSEK